MRLSTTLADPVLLLEQHLNNSRLILKESCEGLLEEQKKVVRDTYQHFIPLIEATLTAQQIQQLFGEVEKATSGEKTVAGKVAKFAALGATAGIFADAFTEIFNTPDVISVNNTPVEGVQEVQTEFDSRKFNNILDSYREELERLPKHQFVDVYEGMTIDDYKQQYAENFFEKLEKTLEVTDPHGIHTDYPINKEQVIKNIKDMVKVTGDFPEDYKTGVYDATLIRGIFVLDETHWQDFSRAVEGEFKGAQSEKATQWLMKNGFIEGAEGSAADAAGNSKPLGEPRIKTFGGRSPEDEVPFKSRTKESYYLQQRPLSEGQVYVLFNRIEALTEGPLLDKVKARAAKAATSAATSVKNKAAEVGKNITNKVTASKLNAAWKNEKFPKDSNEIAQFLKKQGISDDVIDQVYASMNIEPPSAAASDSQSSADATTTDLPKNIIAKIDGLSLKDKQSLLNLLKQESGSAV